MTPEETKIARAFVECGQWKWLPGMRAVGRKWHPASWFRVQEHVRAGQVTSIEEFEMRRRIAAEREVRDEQSKG